MKSTPPANNRSRAGRSLRIVRLALLGAAALLVAAACATETHNTVETQSVTTYNTAYSGTRYPLVVGKFANRSTYMSGIFSDGKDRLGSQAKTILKTHLAQTNRFTLMDRENMEEIAQESKLAGKEQALKGASLVVTGEVTEFGRKVTGDRAGQGADGLRQGFAEHCGRAHVGGHLRRAGGRRVQLEQPRDPGHRRHGGL